MLPHKHDKASGPDGIHDLCCRSLPRKSFQLLPKSSHKAYPCTGTLPSSWTKANVAAIFKKGSRTDPADYRPVSLTSVCCKIIGHVIFSHVMRHLDHHKALIDSAQHGFRARRSCETQLLTTVHKIWQANENIHQADAIILDFAKAFDSVPHRRLLHKLHHFGIEGSLYINGSHPSSLGDSSQLTSRALHLNQSK